MIKMAMGMATTAKYRRPPAKSRRWPQQWPRRYLGSAKYGLDLLPQLGENRPQAGDEFLHGFLLFSGRQGPASGACFVGTLSPRGATPRGKGPEKTPWRHFPGIISYFAENTSQAPTLAVVSPLGF